MWISDIFKTGEKQVKNDKNALLKAALTAQISLMLVGPVIVGIFVGIWLDDYFRTTPLLVITGIILGFIGSILNIFEIMKKIQ